MQIRTISLKNNGFFDVLIYMFTIIKAAYLNDMNQRSCKDVCCLYLQNIGNQNMKSASLGNKWQINCQTCSCEKNKNKQKIMCVGAYSEFQFSAAKLCAVLDYPRLKS